MLVALKQESSMAYRDETTYLGVRIEPALKASIERIAAAEDRSVSNWVQRVLAKEVARVEEKNA
jgi:predicted HicB family RNase H-like nuclease